MYSFLIRTFVKNWKETGDPIVRERYGTFAGAFGIFTNLLLFAMKIAVGLAAGAVSVVADAINNLSDSGASILTIVGFRIASKPADDEHPYGHARFEYLTGLGISVIILLVGFELLKSSADKLIHPETPDFSVVTIAVLVLSIFMKLYQGLFYKKVGKTIRSETLSAAFADSFNDSLSTLAVLIGTVVTFFSGVVLDGYIGIAVSLFILYSGVKLIAETARPLIGSAPDAELVDRIAAKLSEYPLVLGIHDLAVHSYGEGKCYASVHAEVDAKGDILEIHDGIDVIERDFLKDTGIVLVIHMDPVITDSEELNTAREKMRESVREICPDMTLHDFRAVFGTTHTNLIFDVCVPYSFRMTEEEIKRSIQEKAEAINEKYFTVVTVDRDYTGTKH